MYFCAIIVVLKGDACSWGGAGGDSITSQQISICVDNI